MAFNLSKNNDPVPTPGKNVWVVVLLAVIVMLGVAIRYFIPKKEVVPMEAAAVSDSAAGTIPVSTATSTSPPKPTSTPTPTPTPTPPSTSNSTPASPPLSLVAASFNKGTSAPISISDEVVDKIKQAHKITLFGYASSEGDLTSNLKLSQQRAESFKQYLVSKGVDAAIITTVGKGIENPVASNDTETGRTQNRRVEVSIE